MVCEIPIPDPIPDPILSVFTLTEVPVEANLKLQPLYAPTGEHLLKHLVVDAWGAPMSDPGPQDPGDPGEVECSGPWTWVKFAFFFVPDPERFLNCASVQMFDVALGEGYPLIMVHEGMPLPGTAWASSEEEGCGAGNAFDDSMGVSWVSEQISDPGDEWIAFEFDSPATFDTAYLTMDFPDVNIYAAGAVMASNDSTNGVDGTWYIFRDDLFPMPDLSLGTYSLTIPLCSEDEITWTLQGEERAS